MNDFNECSDEERPKISKTSKKIPIFSQYDDFTSVFSEPGSVNLGELRPKLRRGGIKDV